MKSHCIDYSQMIGLLADYKERLTEDHLETPFRDATDAMLSRAAGEYLRLFVADRQQHVRAPCAFRRLLEIVGYTTRKMRSGEIDNLLVDHDDLDLRLTNFASYLLSPIEDKLQWCVSTVTIDELAETITVTVGKDYRIRRYYELSKEARLLASNPAGIRLPRVVKEISDLEEAERAFQDVVNSIFNQIDSVDVAAELKARFVEFLSKRA